MPAASPRFAHDSALIAFGKTVRQTRAAIGISQEELAHRAGLDRSYVSSIERGAQNPGLMAVKRIAAALEVPIAYLMLEARL